MRAVYTSCVVVFFSVWEMEDRYARMWGLYSDGGVKFGRVMTYFVQTHRRLMKRGGEILSDDGPCFE